MDEPNPVPQAGAWSAKEARAHFGEVLDAALSGRPQHVTRGGETVVVVAEAEWRRLSAEKPKMTFGEFLATFPVSRDDIDLTEARHRPMRPNPFAED